MVADSYVHVLMYMYLIITLVDGGSNSIAHDRVCGWVVQAPLYPNREHAKGVKR